MINVLSVAVTTVLRPLSSRAMRKPSVFCPTTAEPRTNKTVKSKEWIKRESENIWVKFEKPIHFGCRAPVPVKALLVNAMYTLQMIGPAKNRSRIARAGASGPSHCQVGRERRRFTVISAKSKPSHRPAKPSG